MNRMRHILELAITLLNAERENSGLDYLSKIDGEDGAWYFWLSQTEGVYEFKELTSQVDNSVERSGYAIKYYPSLDEDAFEQYSFAEQLLRVGELFEQGIVNNTGGFDFCPCCGGKHDEHHQHEHCKPRAMGIPSLLKRCQIADTAFLIGYMRFYVEDEELRESVLTTQDRLVQIADAGITVSGQDDIADVIVPEGGIDREIPGLQLCRVFHHFLLKKLLGKMNIRTIGEFVQKEMGTYVHAVPSGSYYETAEESVEAIAIKNIY